MARKNKRLKTEYRKGLRFDPRKYISAPLLHTVHIDDERTPQRGEVWFADLGNHKNSSVQGGVRPVIIVSNNIGNVHADTVNIVPMTIIAAFKAVGITANCSEQNNGCFEYTARQILSL